MGSSSHELLKFSACKRSLREIAERTAQSQVAEAIPAPPAYGLPMVYVVILIFNSNTAVDALPFVTVEDVATLPCLDVLPRWPAKREHQEAAYRDYQ
jgi:hypothetical protein